MNFTKGIKRDFKGKRLPGQSKRPWKKHPSNWEYTHIVERKDLHRDLRLLLPEENKITEEEYQNLLWYVEHRDVPLENLSSLTPLSQILLRRKYPVPIKRDFLGTKSSLIAAQSRIRSSHSSFTFPDDERKRYLLSGRDLGYLTVRQDIYTIFISLLEETNRVKRAEQINTLSKVYKESLKIANGLKWYYMSPRPEEVSLSLRLSKEYDNWTTRKIITQITPEGCPLSPTFPSLTSTIASALGETIKHFIDTDKTIPILIPDENGSDLIKTGVITTWGQEIDKLVNNLADGRLWAGCAFPKDVEIGKRLGKVISQRVS